MVQANPFSRGWSSVVLLFFLRLTEADDGIHGGQHFGSISGNWPLPKDQHEPRRYAAGSGSDGMGLSDVESDLPVNSSQPLKIRVFRSRREMIRKKLQRKLRRKPQKMPDSGHEDDHLLESEFSMTTVTSSEGAMWTSEAALSTENTDTDRGLEREGGFAFRHLISEKGVITDHRVRKMCRRMNMADPYARYKNHFFDKPQFSAKPYRFSKKMHEIQSIENLHTYIKLSNTDGHPNITVVAFLSYHIKFRMQSKLMCPYLDKGCIDSKIPAIWAVCDVGKYPALAQASDSIVYPMVHIYVHGKKCYDFAGVFPDLLESYLYCGFLYGLGIRTLSDLQAFESVSDME